MLAFDEIHNVNIRLHGLVVGVDGPLHQDVRGDAEGKGVDDGSATPVVGPPTKYFGDTEKCGYLHTE